MTEIHVETIAAVPTPLCNICGGATRIYGIEPHPRLSNTDINTYVCDACDTSQALVVPLQSKFA